jgi:hypothetical protein
MLLVVPGMTREQYDQINEKVLGSRHWGPADAPEGLLVHSAGPTDGGWYAYDIWESREHYERFAQERLLPTFAALLPDGAPPPDVQPQFFEVANFVRV